jgi:hypothetical protein
MPSACTARCQNAEGKIQVLLFKNASVFLSRETLHAKLAIRDIPHESEGYDDFLSATSSLLPI